MTNANMVTINKQGDFLLFFVLLKGHFAQVKGIFSTDNKCVHDVILHCFLILKVNVYQENKSYIK